MRGLKWTQLACLVGMAAMPLAAHGQVVISQIYGGGGAASSYYLNDYVELYNKGATDVSLSGWSIQYQSATGTAGWSGLTVLPATAVIPAGHYFLIAESATGSGAGAIALPVTPDATGTISMGAAAGKIALVSNGTALTGCPLSNPAVVDLVGYGTTAVCSEGGSAPATNAPPSSVTTAIFRGPNGCIDTNNNASDFVSGSVIGAPRNSAVAFTCPASTPPTGSASVAPTQQCPGFNVAISVAVTPGTNPGGHPITSVIADLTSLGGSPLTMLDDGVPPDVTANDGIYTGTAFVPADAATGNHSVDIAMTDNFSRTGHTTATVVVKNCNPTGFGTANPPGVCDGTSTLLTVAVTPGQQPASTGIQVLADMRTIDGGIENQPFYDDGTHGDAVAGDNIFSLSVRLDSATTTASPTIFFVVSDAQGRSNGVNAHFSVSHAPCTDSNAPVVISQVYGGGGNNGGVFRNDFIELFNRTNGPVDISNWSLWRLSSTEVFDPAVASHTDLIPVSPATSIILESGHYFLVQESQGLDGTQPALPAPDYVGVMTVSSTGPATIVLVNSLTQPASCSDASIVDKVAYGSMPTCFEGAGPSSGTSNPVGVHRVNFGCQDSNNNNIDLFIAAPTPRTNPAQVFQCHCGSADFNCDGDTGTDSDIESFFACLSGNCPPAPCQSTADFNKDGDVGTDADIEAFFRVLGGNPC